MSCFFNSQYSHPDLQISYQSIESSDPGINVPGPRRTVSKLRNETYHMFSGLHPGTTYLVSVRARTTKGFGQTALTEITTNISGERLVEFSLPVFVFVFYFKTEENWDENKKKKKRVLISVGDGKKNQNPKNNNKKCTQCLVALVCFEERFDWISHAAKLYKLSSLTERLSRLPLMK